MGKIWNRNRRIARSIGSVSSAVSAFLESREEALVEVAGEPEWEPDLFVDDAASGPSAIDDTGGCGASDGSEDMDDVENVALNDEDENLASHSSTDDEENEKREDDADNLGQQLKEIFSNPSVPRVVVTQVLKALHPHFPELPLDARTLLGVPSVVPISTHNGGSYSFLDLKSLLQSATWIRDDVLIVKMQFNCDGIPPFRSSPLQCWILSCRLVGSAVSKVFPVVLYVGRTKPDEDYFFGKFIADLNEVLDEGIFVNDRLRRFEVHSFICDAPARSFCRGTVGHNHRLACERCRAEGTFNNRRMSYPTTSSSLRTDVSIRIPTEEDEEHRPRVSPLLRVAGLNMVDDFVLDYLHLCLLGVMRKLLFFWMKGPSPRTRLSRLQKLQISERLESIANFIPSCFSRRSRSLASLAYWKGSEYRTFLLYTGPVVLKGILDQAVYRNFLLFSSAMWLLLESDYPDHQRIDTASHLLELFVEHSRDLYGSVFLSYNVHSLLHLCDDVRHKGSPDLWSAFPFESFLYQVKRCIRQGKSPLVQIAKRFWCATVQAEEVSTRISRVRDRFFYVDGKPFEVVERLPESCISGRFLTDQREFSNYPFALSAIGIKRFDSVGPNIFIHSEQLNLRFVCLPCHNSNVVFSLRHT